MSIHMGKRHKTKPAPNWKLGETVDVGFVKGLVVIKIIPHPPVRSSWPVFILRQWSTGRVYAFQPHNGMTRHESVDAAVAYLKEEWAYIAEQVAITKELMAR